MNKDQEIKADPVLISQGAEAVKILFLFISSLCNRKFIKQFTFQMYVLSKKESKKLIVTLI